MIEPAARVYRHGQPGLPQQRGGPLRKCWRAGRGVSHGVKRLGKAAEIVDGGVHFNRIQRRFRGFPMGGYNKDRLRLSERGSEPA